ncbi:hypothetical protein FRB99_003704 [Tulasnella sp. 403]|nr:hypothetical protein FRB99_003704 [Tulasnella sp. 403]
MQVHTNGIVFFALSLATNFITTSLVAGRIWWLSHKVYVPGLSTGRYNAVVAMLIESGILYSSIKVCELVLWVLSSNAFFIVFASMAQIMCITPTAIFIFVALGIVDSGQQFQTMDPTGRSVAGGGAISGASFRFARPFTTTFPRSNTVGSINGPSLPIASYAGAKRPSVVDFKVSADDTVVDGRHSGSSKMKDVSEHSSFEERKSVRSFVVDDEVERDLERQDGEIQQQPCHRRVEGLHQRRESTQTDTPTLHVPPTSSDAIHATGIVP